MHPEAPWDLDMPMAAAERGTTYYYYYAEFAGSSNGMVMVFLFPPFLQQKNILVS